LACPICQKRKAKRFCPAKAEMICSVCCGTEREVTIDCPSDCPYLIASRGYDESRRVVDWSKLPFAEVKIPPSFAREHGELLAALSYAVCAYARENRSLVDSDAIAALQALAETFKTLSGGIYYEKAPDYVLQRGLYEALKAAIDEFRKEETQRKGMSSTRDSDVRDALVFFAQVGASRTNGRPKGRAYLDLLRTQFPTQEFSKPASNILIVP
jgi:hypothetical protein